MRAEAVASVGPGGRARLHLGPLGIRVLSVLLGLGAWEAYGQVLRSPIFTYPSAIVRAGVLLVRTGELAYYLQASLVVLAGGLFLAILFGIPFGVVMARSSLVEYATEPYMNALYATPTVALIPVIVLWLGFQTTAKVALVFLFCVFPILINTYQGVRSVDRRLVEVARSFCSGEWALWRDVILPSATPFLLAGIRLAIGRGLVGMVVAEFYTSITGLGYMIVQYANTFKTDRLFVPIVVLMILGVGLTGLLKAVERRIAPWMHMPHEE
ncbi:MAG: ABC transporter permease [candidate division GAL15 bacterium]